MQHYRASLMILLLIGTVVTRVLLMHRSGMNALQFGKIDKKDFLIPPFALLFFYVVFAAAFDWPALGKQVFFHSDAVAWVGVLLCTAGFLLVLLCLVSFGSSFRVGIDANHPGELVITGVFALSRNPIYSDYCARVRRYL